MTDNPECQTTPVPSLVTVEASDGDQSRDLAYMAPIGTTECHSPALKYSPVTGRRGEGYEETFRKQCRKSASLYVSHVVGNNSRTVSVAGAHHKHDIQDFEVKFA